MPLTLRDLVADPELGLAVRAGDRVLDRPVTWVHTSELTDPSPFLEGGELLLTTGLALRRADCAGLVDALTSVGAAGLGFGVGLSHREVPAELVAAAERAGLPLLEVPRPTPFIAISKAVSRTLAADEYASLRRTSRAQHELAQAAGTGGVAA
ncbi:PucR family transcriptional regulator ligand-binding domain-containing protein, partial [Saccharopolyspora hordei]